MDFEAVARAASELTENVGNRPAGGWDVVGCQADDVVSAATEAADRFIRMLNVVDESLTNLGDGARRASAVAYATDQAVAASWSSVAEAFVV